MTRNAVPTWCFAMVVVRLGRRFLLVRERDGTWYLPAGRVEPGETFFEAAVRETHEEAGIAVAVEGVLRVEHSPAGLSGARMRVFVVARPCDDTAPKSVADQHSREARWVTREELDALPLRGDEVRAVLDYVSAGGAVYPLSLWSHEGAPW
jgi:8-oxo-dGTP pyrophosphatase MutT (NUDIX family)